MDNEIGKSIYFYTFIDGIKYYLYFITQLKIESSSYHGVFGLNTEENLNKIYKSELFMNDVKKENERDKILSILMMNLIIILFLTKKIYNIVFL